MLTTETNQSAALRQSSKALDVVRKPLSLKIIIHKDVLPPNVAKQMAVSTKDSMNLS